LAGRTPREAVHNFVATLKAVIGCVTSEGFVTRYSRRGGSQQTASFQDDFAIVSRRNGRSLKVELVHRSIVIQVEGERGPWAIRTAEYIYEVADESEDLIAAFHWHPGVAQLVGHLA
jgi:hypothetical protein